MVALGREADFLHSTIDTYIADAQRENKTKLVEQGLIVTKRGLVDKHTFYLPQILVDRFDGQTLFLKVTDKDTGKFV